MSSLRLGVVDPTWKNGHRDALHVPVVLVTSEESMKPGDNVRFTDNTFTKVVESDKKDRHGVVDIFMKKIKIGDPFMVLICPEFTTNPVHHFDVNIRDVDLVSECPVPGITLSEHQEEVQNLKYKLDDSEILIKELQDKLENCENNLADAKSEVEDLRDKGYDYDDGCRGC